jgi:hypothetical protein
MQTGITEINDLLLAKLVGTSRSNRVKRWIETQDWRDENIGIDKLEVITFWGENAMSVYTTEVELRKFAQDILDALPIDERYAGVVTLKPELKNLYHKIMDGDDCVNDCLANHATMEA